MTRVGFSYCEDLRVQIVNNLSLFCEICLTRGDNCILLPKPARISENGKF
jgi:hypothetical protein